jgi:hypothetical protein
MTSGGSAVPPDLVSDHEGGQRAISRFGLFPGQASVWMFSVVRHWNLDRIDPR